MPNAMGPDALSSVSLINKSEYRIRELLERILIDQKQSTNWKTVIRLRHYISDEQRRIKL